MFNITLWRLYLWNIFCSTLQISRQLHTHEYPGCEEWNQYANETYGYKEYSIQFGSGRIVSPIQDDKADSAHRKQKTGRQSFHNILTVYSVGHKRHGSRVTVFISGRTHTWWFDDHVEYYTWKLNLIHL